MEREAELAKAEAERKRLEAEEKAKLDAEAEKQRLEKEAELAKAEAEKLEKDASKDFINKLEQDFKNSINNSKIKKVLVEGKEVSKSEALKLSIFDVETSIITFDKVNGDGTLEIKLTKK